MKLERSHPAQPSGPLDSDQALALDDATLGAVLVSSLSWQPTEDAFAALGEAVRARPEVLARILRRRRPR